MSLPVLEFTHYGRHIGLYAESECFVVGGHDRRSWAALNAQGRDVEGTHWRMEPHTVRARWGVFLETCGCTPEAHTDHVDCPDEMCVYLRPCGREWSWTVLETKPDHPHAVPFLELLW